MPKPLHPSFPSWLDYVRIGEGPGKRGPATHLRAGCDDCRSTADSVAAFARFVRDDRQYEPPASVVADAMAIFRQSDAHAGLDAVALEVAAIYDSRLAGAEAGMRSAGRPTQLLYQADRFSLDVQLTREHASNQVLVVGQIMDRVDTQRQVARAPITVASANDTLARSFTNEFGEFQVEYLPQGDLRLKIVVDEGRAFVIPLPKLSEMETR